MSFGEYLVSGGPNTVSGESDPVFGTSDAMRRPANSMCPDTDGLPSREHFVPAPGDHGLPADYDGLPARQYDVSAGFDPVSQHGRGHHVRQRANVVRGIRDSVSVHSCGYAVSGSADGLSADHDDLFRRELHGMPHHSDDVSAGADALPG